MATGTGKTWVAADVILRAVQQGWRVLFLAHREELLDQATATVVALDRQVPLGLVKAEREEWGPPIVFASVASLSPERLSRMPRFHLVLTDEAHHAGADTYQRVYTSLRREYPPARHLGFTATPYTSLGHGKTAALDTFDEVAFEYGLRAAMDDGWLVPEIIAVRIPTGQTISSAADHDLSMKGLDNADRNMVMVGAYRSMFPAYPPGLAFCVNVHHAKALADLFRSVGVPAQAVWGSMDNELGAGSRRAALEAYQIGRTRVLTTVALLTEGYDAPATSVLLMGRPTASLVFWMQMLGRGTRPSAGKGVLAVLDFTDNVAARLDLRPAGLGDVVEGVRTVDGPYELFRVSRRAS